MADQPAAGLVMTDPRDPRHTVWVRLEDRATYERAGYTAVPSEEERKPARPTRAPRATEPQPAPPAVESPPPPSEDPPTAAADDGDAGTQGAATVPPEGSPAVSFPRRVSRPRPRP